MHPSSSSALLRLLFVAVALFSSPAGAQVVISEFMASSSGQTPVPNQVSGTSEDWIEIWNQGTQAVDLGGWHLTDDFSNETQWTFPSGTMIAAGGYLIVYASGDNAPDANGNLHTNFKLSAGGDFVGLITPSLTFASGYSADGGDYPAQQRDISFGLDPIGGGAVYFETPTPGAANAADGVLLTATPAFSVERGYYTTDQTVVLTTATAGATIRYTLDGSEPTDSGAGGITYTAPLSVTTTSVVRAKALQVGRRTSETISHTYIFPLDITTQTRPAGYPTSWGDEPNADYDVDSSIANSQQYAARFQQGLRAVPTLSVSGNVDAFFGANGIYVQTQNRALEQPVSAEYFHPGATDGVNVGGQFHIDCGIKLQGGASRNPASSIKHSMSLRFRRIYGEGELRFPLFEEEGEEAFDAIHLRAGYNNSWIHRDINQRNRAAMMRDQWARSTMLAMGNEDGGRGRYVHLYLNGLYWGLYNLHERFDNDHYANYNGFSSDEVFGYNPGRPTAEEQASFEAMKSVVTNSSSTWAQIEAVIDVDNYIDFFLVQNFAGNDDLKASGNWRAAGGGPANAPWRFYCWDTERTLENPSDTGPLAISQDGAGLIDALDDRPEFRRRFADRAAMHLAPGGALENSANRDRISALAGQIDLAIIGESARWGDDRSGGGLGGKFTRDENWAPAVYEAGSIPTSPTQGILGSWFPVNGQDRTQRILQNWTTRTWPNQTNTLLSAVAAPAFTVDGTASNGGFVAQGSDLSLTGAQGTIYYTLDGSDPADASGAIRPGVASLSGTDTRTTVFTRESSNWFYHDRATAFSTSAVVSGAPGYSSSDWKHPDFVPTTAAGWQQGQGLLGSGAVGSLVNNTTLDPGPSGARTPTIYFRRDFQIADASAVNVLEFSIVADDGAIVYLNGKEVIRHQLPAGTIEYSDYTGVAIPDEDAPRSFTVNLSPGDLVSGRNVLAVELHQGNSRSSDLGFDMALEAVESAPGNTIPLTESSVVIARVLSSSGLLSAPSQAIFLREPRAAAGDLVITEISYNPFPPTVLELLAWDAAGQTTNLDAGDFEYIEVQNIGANLVNLSGVTISGGLTVTGRILALAPGQHAVFVENEEAFELRYGSGIPIAGDFAGALSNEGEQLTLTGDGTIEQLTYQSSGAWPGRANGRGSSLQRRLPSASGDLPGSWRSSLEIGGSPGVAGRESDDRVVINEVLANTSMSSEDKIELFNPGAVSIDLSGWFLTDNNGSFATYQSYTFPSGSVLAAGSYLVIDGTDFGVASGNAIAGYSGTAGAAPTIVSAPGHGLQSGDVITISGYGGISDFNDTFEVEVVSSSQFRIDGVFLDNATIKGVWELGRSFGLGGARGEDLYLVEASGGKPSTIVDRVDFAGSLPGRSLGRFPNGAGDSTLLMSDRNTLSATNSAPRIGRLVISEVMYAPSTGASEFIEITNSSEVAVSLEGWRIRGGADYDFASARQLESGESLVIVPFNPIADGAAAAAFRSDYGVGTDVVLVGAFSDGPLADISGTVRLDRPIGSGHATEDVVEYASVSPWPMAQNGVSLQRVSPVGFGNFATSWEAATPNPGSFTGVLESSFDDWASDFGVVGITSDPDSDGVTNLIEFALGTNPLERTSASSPFLSVTGASQSRFEFQRPKGRRGISYLVEFSEDLDDWDEVGVVVTDNGSSETISVEQPLLDFNKGFYRLAVIIQP